MKFLITGFAYQPYPKIIADKIREMGHDVCLHPFLDFYHGSSYIKRKLWKMGLKREEVAYERKETRKFLKIYNDYNPDVLLVLGHTIFAETLKKINGCKKVLWLWDSLIRFPEIGQLVPYFENVFCFEENDINIIKEKYGKEAQYLPLGYDELTYKPENLTKNIDVCFIGVKTHERLALLNEVAGYMKQKRRRMFIGGKWFEEKHFWKKGHFLKKYPNLEGILENRWLTPQEIATIYNKSKICLNVSVNEHKSLNPRTFEVLATKNFLLMNNGQLLNSVQGGLVEYYNVTDLISKIDYYLEHEMERLSVAENGYDKVKDKYSLKKLVKIIIETVEV